MSILATFLHRMQTLKPNNPLLDWSANSFNDSHPMTTVAANGSVLIADSLQTDGVGCGMPQLIPHALGGSRSLGIRSATWVTIAEWQHPLINPAGVVTALARVERKTAGAAVVVTLTSNAIANPTSVLCAAPHGLVTGQTVTIAGVSTSAPTINGVWTVTVIDSTHFSIPVNVTVAGSGGTVTVAGTSVQVRLIDVDNASAVVGTGLIASLNTSWLEETFAIALNLAAHHYELQIQGGNASADVFAVGRVELYAA
jgi:hypothetical protein